MADGNANVQDQQDQQPAPDGGVETATPQPADGDLRAQLDAARAEAAQYKDKYLREYADKDNFRKRQERILSDRLRYEKRDLLGRLLEYADHLDLATQHLDTMSPDMLRQTLKMMRDQFGDLLRGEGLAAVPGVGAPFDPRVHDAIETVATTAYPEGTVTEEVRRGYLLGDETLRPARVKVSASK